MGVGIESVYLNVGDLLPDSQRCIRGQGPRCGGPGQNAHIALRHSKEEFRSLVSLHAELRHHARVFHFLVAARLVEFMGTQSRAIGG